MQILRCLHPQSSFSGIPDSRGLIGGPFSTSWHKPRCCKYTLPCTPYYYCQLQILAALLSSCLSAPFLCCFALATIREKCYGSSIILAIRICRFGYPPGTKVEKTQKNLLSAFDCIWFWYICCLTKFSYQEHNF